MTTEFHVRRLYTWSDNRDWCHTATVYKDGEKHLTMAKANAWCEKWNGRRGDFEVKK